MSTAPNAQAPRAPFTGRVTKPARVLFVQPVLPSYRVPVFAGLAKRGFEVTCWSDHHPPSSLKHVDASGLFETRDHPERRIGPFISQLSLIKAAWSDDFDTLVFPWNIRYLELPLALLGARMRGVPCVLWGHARSKQERKTSRFLRNAAGRGATACMTYDEGARLEVIQEGFTPSRVFTAKNALDNQSSRDAELYWAEHQQDLLKFRANRGIEDRPLVLYVSRLEPEKRIDRLLRSFGKVVQAIPSARLIIIGSGPEEEALRALAASLNLAEMVSFVGAIHDERTLAAWFSSAKVLAYPTNLGLSLLHAFSYGVPVITSDRASEHGPEFFALRPGENGLTYRSGDEVHFAQQIIACLTDPSLQERLSAGARSTIDAPGGFNLETMLDGMEAALRFAIAQGKPRGYQP